MYKLSPQVFHEQVPACPLRGFGGQASGGDEAHLHLHGHRRESRGHDLPPAACRPGSTTSRETGVGEGVLGPCETRLVRRRGPGAV